MVLILESLGISCEYHHHEVATAGQCEIDMRFTTLVRMARPAHDLQVRRPQLCEPRGQGSDLHAEADLRRQRLGHALPPVALEGTARP